MVVAQMFQIFHDYIVQEVVSMVVVVTTFYHAHDSHNFFLAKRTKSNLSLSHTHYISSSSDDAKSLKYPGRSLSGEGNSCTGELVASLGRKARGQWALGKDGWYSIMCLRIWFAVLPKLSQATLSET